MGVADLGEGLWGCNPPMKIINFDFSAIILPIVQFRITSAPLYNLTKDAFVQA